MLAREDAEVHLHALQTITKHDDYHLLGDDAVWLL
jgi:hypothetical protein